MYLVTRLFNLFLDYVPCPLFENSEIQQQPADFLTLTSTYANGATSFIKTKAGKNLHYSLCSLAIHVHCPASGTPFFLYFAFQHTHQPQFAGKEFTNTTLRGPFGDSLAELDWGVGQVMKALKDSRVDNDTFVFFTADNGYSSYKI